MKWFIVLSRVPYPLDKGDKLRAYHFIKQLSQSGFELNVCCLHFNELNIEIENQLKLPNVTWHFIQLSKWKTALLPFNIFTKKPFQVCLFEQKKAKTRINKLLEEIKPEVVFSQLIRTTEYCKNYANGHKIIDYMDALGEGMRRRSEKSNFPMNILFKIESNRLRNYERTIWSNFDEHLVISSQDCRLIDSPNPTKWKIVENGIDTIFFSPKNDNSKIDFTILFTGNMSYPPNIDAVLFLAKEIMPLVWNKIPKCKLTISGVDPDRSIKNLENELIEVTGKVDDIRTAYSTATLFVAPMRIGTGMQNKILEALSMELPVITTSMAANAFENDIQSHLNICDNANEIAESAIRMLSSKNMQRQTEARKLLSEKYNWESKISKWLKTLQ
jgi:glycosyltransferase involved in cell wall biosynthesis